MKSLFVLLLFIFTFGQTFGQKKQCHCEKNSLMNEYHVDCKTTFLKNNSKLYWQFNCDKIWLTLETPHGRKVTINEVPVDLYGYTYRLGFHLIKEYDKSILFRGGCPANGPCSYTLIDKNTGKTIDDFGQLICIDTEIEGNKKYQFDFLVYFSENYDKLKIYYVNSKKILTIPFSTKRNNLNAVTSEYQFTNMKVEGNILTLYYTRSDNKNSNLKINLKNKKYSLYK